MTRFRIPVALILFGAVAVQAETPIRSQNFALSGKIEVAGRPSIEEWHLAGSLSIPTKVHSVDSSILIPVLLALLGIAGAYWNSVSTELRKSRISFVNDQLKYLYGPLFALSQSSEAAWNSFRQKNRPNGSFFNSDQPPTQQELNVWVLWMKTVFWPINDNMAKSIIENSHLIEGSNMPNSFVALMAHVEGYRIVMSKWDKGDFTSYTSGLDYQVNINQDIQMMFDSLKDRQQKLMGTLYQRVRDAVARKR